MECRTSVLFNLLFSKQLKNKYVHYVERHVLTRCTLWTGCHTSESHTMAILQYRQWTFVISKNSSLLVWQYWHSSLLVWQCWHSSLLVWQYWQLPVRIGLDIKMFTLFTCFQMSHVTSGFIYRFSIAYWLVHIDSLLHFICLIIRSFI